MYRIRKQFTFEAAHQLEPGCFTEKCSDCIHGHSYTVELLVKRNNSLDAHAMVMDFGELKPFIRDIMELFDHGLILHRKKQKIYQPLIDAGHLKASKVTFMDFNPTAESIAGFIFTELWKFLSKSYPNVRPERVRVHETSNGWAEYEE